MRAERRHQQARAKAKAAAWLRRVGANADERSVGREAARHMTCSCWMCGNPRKWFGELSVHEASDRQMLAADKKKPA